MSERERPANRRLAWRIKFVWRSASDTEFSYFGTVSYAGPPSKPDLTRPLEIFINSSKTTSDASHQASEAAIFASLALQRGVTIDELLESTIRLEDGRPATAVGSLLLQVRSGEILPPEARAGYELRQAPEPAPEQPGTTSGTPNP